MNNEKFREFGYAAIDFLAEYAENVHDRKVLPCVEPGYLHDLLPTDAPEKPENWEIIMNDIKDKIMPGMTHWKSSHFHAYYPIQSSFPSIIGDVIANGLAAVPFSWISSPAATELEVIVMDWLGKLLNLPTEYLNCSNGFGGGVLQGTASEAILIAMVTAREQAVKRLKNAHPNLSESEIRGKLVMYSSDQSNGTVQKQAQIAAVPIRLLPVDQWTAALRGHTLKKAMEEDIQNGLFPIACIATLGTTATCAFDNLVEIGPICRESKMWLHIDAAYAGSALCCAEFRWLMPGVEYGDSFAISLYKWMMQSYDACAMWFKDASQAVDTLSMDRIYLKHTFQGGSKAPDYRHWHTGLGRRFRALKVWVTLRTEGVENIREMVRSHVRLARLFESKVRKDDRFEIAARPALGLVCFRLKGGCEKTQLLLEKINERKNIYMVHSKCDGKWMIRFVVCAIQSEEKDIEFAWNEILSVADVILERKLIKDKLSTDFANNIQVYNEAPQTI